MDCPRCSKAMVEAQLDGITIDECSACKGLWFDAEQLRHVRDAEAPDLRWMDFEFWEHPERFHLNEGSLSCPRCDEAMPSLRYGETEVEVDCCRSCRGTFLDAGELQQILAAQNKALAARSSGGYVRASLKELGDLVRGPETLASEWKDLKTVLRLLGTRILAEHPGLQSVAVEIDRANPLR